MASWLRSIFGRRTAPDVRTRPMQPSDVRSTDNSQEGPERPAATGMDPVPTQGGAPIHVTEDSFDDLVLASKVPVLVDVWADWCGPCRMMAPILEELAAAYNGRAVIAKLDADEHPAVTQQMGIMGLPTVLFFVAGREVDRVLGFSPRHVLEERLNAVLSQVV